VGHFFSHPEIVYPFVFFPDTMRLIKFFSILLVGFLLLPNAFAAQTKGKILVLLSSENTLALKEGKTYSTGYYLNEFGVPADRFLKAGYEIVLATPKGNAPSVDQSSIDPAYFGGSTDEMKRIQGVVASLADIQHPLALDKVLAGNLGQYAAIFMPGGHAPLIDLANNPKVGKLLAYFHTANKPTAAICHGPITLLSAQDDPQAFEAGMVAGKPVAASHWIYQGYRMTIFSTPEEEFFESTLKGAKVRYYPAAALKAAGGNTEFAEMWKSHVVVDRELITGQNPFSDQALAQAMLEALAAK
jgi:putative intracellular protease/amidase